MPSGGVSAISADARLGDGIEFAGADHHGGDKTHPAISLRSLPQDQDGTDDLASGGILRISGKVPLVASRTSGALSKSLSLVPDTTRTQCWRARSPASKIHRHEGPTPILVADRGNRCRRCRHRSDAAQSPQAVLSTLDMDYRRDWIGNAPQVGARWSVGSANTLHCLSTRPVRGGGSSATPGAGWQ